MDIALSAKVGELLATGRRERLCHNRFAALAAFAAAAELDPYDVLVKIELATELRVLDRFEEAEAVLDSLLDPGQHQARISIERGLLLRRRGDNEGAAAAFKSAAAREPYNINIQVELARDLRVLDRLTEADIILNNILDIEPHHAGALIERGHLRRQQGDREGAVTVFRTAAAADPNNRNIRVEMARDLRALGRLAEADVEIGSVLGAEPRHLGALIERGHLSLLIGNNSEALEVFEAAAAIDAGHAGVQLEIANVLRALGRFSDAEAVLRKLAQANIVAAVVSLGHLLMEASRLHEAETLLAHALGQNPNNARILATRGHLARRRGDRPVALQFFTSASEADPTNLDLRLDLATELREQGDLDGALRRIQSVLNGGDHWGALMQLGQLQRAKGDAIAAIEAFRAAAAREPHKAQGLVELAQETWAAGQPTEAERLIARALAAEPNHLGALLAAAEFALQTQRQDEALPRAQRAVQCHPGKLRPYLVAARAAAQALSRDEAFDFLAQAYAIFGPLPEVVATNSHILRHFRDFNAARSLLAREPAAAAGNFPLWLESTSFAIDMGDFAVADQALKSSPASSKRELARIPLLRAHIAEGRRHYRGALAHYREALVLDPNGGWHAEMARACLLMADIDGARAHLPAAFARERAWIRQLIDEFVLDPGVLAALKRAIAHPNPLQTETLQQLVRDNPDHTAPALLLMLAMRNAGAFSINQATLPSDATPKIPRRIIQYWHADAPPDDVAALMATWRDAHGEYEHVMFNDATAEAFLRAHYPDEIGRAFGRAQEPPQRADILRLAYLASQGGIFVDADDRCLGRLDAVLPAQAEFVGYQDNFAAIGANFLGAAPGHPVIALALKNAIRASNRGDLDIVWLSTGPGLLTRSFAQSILSVTADDWPSRVRLLELWEVQRAVGIYCPVQYKHINHF